MIMIDLTHTLYDLTEVHPDIGAEEYGPMSVYISNLRVSAAEPDIGVRQSLEDWDEDYVTGAYSTTIRKQFLETISMNNPYFKDVSVSEMELAIEQQVRNVLLDNLVEG